MQCDVTDFYGQGKTVTSFGRRRRRRRDTSDKDDLMVAGVIHISDKFELDPGKEEENRKRRKNHHKQATTKVFYDNSDFFEEYANFEEDEAEGPSCMDSFSFAMGALMFLLAQCALIGIWTYIYHKRKQLLSKERQLGSHFDQATTTNDTTAESSLKDYDPYFTSDIYAASRSPHESLNRFSPDTLSDTFSDNSLFDSIRTGDHASRTDDAVPARNSRHHRRKRQSDNVSLGDYEPRSM